MSLLGINEYLYYTFCPHFWDFGGSTGCGTEEPRLLGNKQAENETSTPHQLEQCFPPLYSPKVSFPLGALKGLEVTESWQLTMLWRGSQKGK